jgi:alkyl hydroperoxide reductase subunit AhpC
VIPQLRVWDERFGREGLTIIGVHTPEFLWEKSYEKVVAASRQLGVRYPVVQDNDSAIWKRFGIWAWPTAVLIDKKGTIRYHHIGEGAYEETESVIRRLLAETG